MKSELPRRTGFLAGALVLLGVAVLASVCVGAGTVAPGEVLRAFTDYTGTDAQVVVRDVRVPRTVLAVAVGAALAVAGALVQTLTRNPLAEPGILGVTAGAGFAVTLGAVFGVAGSQSAKLVLAFAGALVAMAVVQSVGRNAPLRLVLAGTALSAVLAGVVLGLRLTLPEVFDTLRFWQVGSLAGREQTPYGLLLGLICVALAGTMLVTRPLNAIALGENVARTLGTRVVRTRVITLALITLLSAAATAAAGPIAFVGLIVPHLARRPATGSIPWLMTYTLVLGPVLMLLSDILARVLLPTGEVPVAVVTAFLGGPALIWAVRRYGTVAL